MGERRGEIMINIYGKKGCGQCEAIKNILKEKNIEFNYNDDMKTLMTVGSKTKIMSAPIIEEDGKFYNFSDFVSHLQENNKSWGARASQKSGLGHGE